MYSALVADACLLKAAYDKHPDNFPPCWDVVAHTERDTDTQVYVAVPPVGPLHVLIPGTQGWRDVWTDLRRDRIQLGGGVEVREGPFVAWCSIRDWLLDTLHSYDRETVRFISHSLGAAIADCGARELAKRESWRVEPVAFGKYLVGNGGFWQQYRQLMPWYVDVRGRYDIVPGVLPWDAHARNKYCPSTVVVNCRHGIERYIKALGGELPAWAEVR
jgi:hypothetical protein